MLFNDLQKEIKLRADPIWAKKAAGYFKTGPGEYAEGDVFIGISNPKMRKLSKKYSKIQIDEIKYLINSLIHEERLLGLLIMIEQFDKADFKVKEKLYKIYISNFKKINNWDLVDLSAPNIVGKYLFDKDRAILQALARNKSLWARRIAIIATQHFIRNNQFDDTINLATILLNDKEDLIHKAVGWMLREVGKRDLLILEKFLTQNYSKMPRTMLRYAIEKFSTSKRQKYLKGTL
jgi:3-methyladenine DNA glycosylase AlkD